MTNNKYLTSLALFRELYDSGNKNPYCILAQFLKYAILTKGIHGFSSTEITNLLNDMYDFSVPEAVVKTSLKSLPFLEKAEGLYNVKESKVKKEDIAKFGNKFEEIKNSNQCLFDELVGFIKEHIDSQQSVLDEESLINAFCSYLIDEEDSKEYSRLISAFIIKNKDNIHTTQRINTIKEGIILYYGIKYTSNPSELGSWGTKLTIYLETEILFSMAGYNGALYSTLFNDLYKLIDEINRHQLRKNKNKLIFLKYFGKTKNEIDSFFNKAEQILRNKDKLNPARPAMVAIVNGCRTPSDIVDKKADLFELLKSKSIILDDVNYYSDEKKYEYNIEDLKIVEDIQKNNLEVDRNDIEQSLQFLNFINILREGKSGRGFENVGYILLSGRTITNQLSWDDNIRAHNEVPLATSLSWLTNRFWFKLNKGFGTDSYPKTFEVITKAQIVLSTQINKSVTVKFEELKKKKRDGNMTDNQVIATLVGLRESVYQPEEIDGDNIDHILNEIKEEELAHFAKEKETLKHNLGESVRRGGKLEEELVENKKIIQQKDTEISELTPFKEQFLRRKIIFKKVKKITSVLIVISLFLALIYSLFLKNILWIAISFIGSAVSTLVFFRMDWFSLKKWCGNLRKKLLRER